MADPEPDVDDEERSADPMSNQHTMKTSPIGLARPDLLAALTHLINGRTLEWTAGVLDRAGVEVEAVVREHGYPDRAVMRKRHKRLALASPAPTQASGVAPRPPAPRPRPDLSVAHTPPPTRTPKEPPVTTAPAPAPAPKSTRMAAPASTTSPVSTSAPGVTSTRPIPHPSIERPALADLVAAASTPAAKRLAEKAQKATEAARVVVEELREQLARDEATQEARAEVERLEAELKAAKAAKARLAGQTRDETPKKQEEGPSSAVIRAWAAGQGLSVPATGRVRGDVRAAYLAANPTPQES